MEKKKQTLFQKIGIGRLLSVLLCLVLTVFFVLNSAAYSTQQSTTAGFTPTNFSGEILQSTPLSVEIVPQSSQTSQIQLRFVAPQAPARYPVTASLYRQAANGSRTLLETWNYKVSCFEGGEYYTHNLKDTLKKGSSYVLELSSQETQAQYAIRLNMGTGNSSEIAAWYWGSELQPDQPEIGLAYAAYRGVWLALFIALLAVAWAAALLKKPLKISGWLQHVLQAGFFLVVPLPVLYAVEKLNRNTLFNLSLLSVLGNYLLCLGLQLLFFAILGRSGWAAGAGGTAVLLFGVINYYVTGFRDTVLLPYDVYALGTAGEVAGGYTYTISNLILLAALLAGALVSLGRWFNFSLRGWRVRILGSAAAVALGLGCLIYPVQCSESFDSWCELYMQTAAARRQGVLMNFALNVPLMKTPVPENYRSETVRNLVPPATKASEDTVYPNIIVVMNESFTDVSTLLQLETNLEVLPNFNRLKDDPAAFVGQVAVPIYGSGTSCTEYEVLTGASLKVDLANHAPYMNYFSKETPTMVSQMKALGYKTLSIHAASGKNWYRDQAYPNMGFETSWFAEDLPMEDYCGRFPADSEGYTAVLKALQETSSPLFTFYLTIQNHGGYYESFEGAQIELQSPAVEWKDEADIYLSLLHESDAQLQEFLTQLQQLEEPTVVLFFGDHWSCFTSQYLKDLGLDTSAFTAEQQLAYYSTPYIMWSNCGYDFSSLPAQTSANYLFPLMLQQLGLPRTSWDEFLLQGAQEFPVFSLYTTVQGTAGSRTLEQYTNQYACLQYNLLVDTKHRTDSVFTSTD